MAGDVLEPLRRVDGDAPLAGAGDDRLAERVLASGLGGGGRSKEAGFGVESRVPGRGVGVDGDPAVRSGGDAVAAVARLPVRERDHVREFHLAVGERPRLVEDDHVDVADAFEHVAALEQDAVRRGDRRPDHRRGRGREPERARTRDEHRGGEDHHRELEDAHAAGDGAAADRSPHRKPADERGERLREEPPDDRPDQRVDDDDGDEHARHPVDEPLDVGLARLGLPDALDDLSDRGVRADLRGLDAEDAVLVDRRADHLVARPLLDGDGLAGEHRLVDRRLPVDDDAVRRHLLAGMHLHHVAGRDLVDRNRAFGPVVVDDRRLVGAQPEQFAKRVARARLRARLEPVSDGDEPEDERDRLEVEVAGQRRADERADEHRRAERVAGGGADRHQRVHVDVAAVPPGAPRSGEELPAERRHEERRDRELEPAEVDDPNRLRHRVGPEHLSHQVPERQREQSAADDEPALSGELRLGGARATGVVGGAVLVAADRLVAGVLDRVVHVF